MSWPLSFRTESPDATRALAARLASVCTSGDMVLLIGELGAGKTVFAQGFAAALGVEGPVTSPTFALVRQYHCTVDGDVEVLLHADVFRTGSLSEVVDLALPELVEERAVALIEWGDMAAPALGADTLSVTVVRPEGPASGLDGVRLITVSGQGSWASRADEVARALSGERRPVAP
jgi:tRNA threonylcarbamoyladenosine biosynthesis protein TsaE